MSDFFDYIADTIEMIVTAVQNLFDGLIALYSFSVGYMDVLTSFVALLPGIIGIGLVMTTTALIVKFVLGR